MTCGIINGISHKSINELAVETDAIIVIDNELSSIYYVRRCADAVPLQHRYCSHKDPVW